MKKLLLIVALLGVASVISADDENMRHEKAERRERGRHEETRRYRSGRYHYDDGYHSHYHRGWGWRPHWCEDGLCCHQHWLSGRVSCYECDYCR